MEKLAFHSFTRMKDDYTANSHWENVLFELGSERVKVKTLIIIIVYIVIIIVINYYHYYRHFCPRLCPSPVRNFTQKISLLDIQWELA